MNQTVLTTPTPRGSVGTSELIADIDLLIVARSHIPMNGMSSSFDTFAMARDFMLMAAPDQQHPRLVVVAFVDKWSPPAMRLSMDIEALRAGNDVRFVQLFVLDAAQARLLPLPFCAMPLPTICTALAQEREAAWDLGVTATPALFCYWEGKPVTVHRSDWEGGFAFVGALSRPQLTEYLRHTRDCCVDCSEKGRPLLAGVEF